MLSLVPPIRVCVCSRVSHIFGDFFFSHMRWNQTKWMESRNRRISISNLMWLLCVFDAKNQIHFGEYNQKELRFFECISITRNCTKKANAQQWNKAKPLFLWLAVKKPTQLWYFYININFCWLTLYLLVCIKRRWNTKREVYREISDIQARFVLHDFWCRLWMERWKKVWTSPETVRCVR